MRAKHLFRTTLIISVLILAMTAWLAMDISGAPPSPEDIVQRARQRVEEAGSYRFTADVEQTMVPRPLPEMIGQRSQRFDLRLEGEALAPDYARMEISTEAAADMPSVTLLQTAEGTFIQAAGALQPADNPYVSCCRHR